LSYGFCFLAKDESGQPNPDDAEFLDLLAADFESTMVNVLHFLAEKDRSVIECLKTMYIYDNQ
jgi:hypothetical protein